MGRSGPPIWVWKDAPVAMPVTKLSNHLIRRLRVEMSCPRSDASRLQVVVGQQLGQGLRAKLRDICDRTRVGASGDASVERLVLDIGEFPLDRFEAEFGPKFLEAFAHALPEAIAGLDWSAERGSAPNARGEESARLRRGTPPTRLLDPTTGLPGLADVVADGSAARRANPHGLARRSSHSGAQQPPSVPPPEARSGTGRTAESGVRDRRGELPASARRVAASRTASARARPGHSMQDNEFLEPTRDLIDPIAITNAGLSLLWPALPGLFRQAGLLENGRFAGIDARHEASWLLDVALSGDEVLPDPHRLTFARLLCGLPIEESAESADLFEADAWGAFTAANREIVGRWIDENRLRCLMSSKISVVDFRALFLRRPGEISVADGAWRVTVEPHPADILIAPAPRSLAQILLPWIAAPIELIWFSNPGHPEYRRPP